MIQSFEEVRALRDALEAEGKKLVFTNGCFDLLHAGHVRYLAEARALGDALVVALNDDESVRSLKGPTRPVNTAGDRAEVLGALRSVDAVAVFSGERATKAIEAIRPHIYAKGGDYTVESLNPEERTVLEKAGTEIAILSLVPGKSTSATLAAMNKAEGGETGDVETGKRPRRLAVLGSGNGSNMGAIQTAIEAGTLGAEIAIVISDVADAKILDRARDAGIPAVFVDPGPSQSMLSASAQKEIADRITASGADLVCLAGFMRIVKAPLLDRYTGRIINIHPSLLPKYPGLAAWKQALENGDRETGCTVHHVEAGIDSGEVIGQRTVPVLPEDTPETLHARIQVEEHQLYPEVIEQLGRNMRIQFASAPGGD